MRWLVLVFFLSMTAEAAMSVPRTVAAVTWAISRDRPDMDLPTQKVWARAIIEEATTHSLDPFTLIAIMHNESRLQPWAEDKEAGCVGLGQYCLDRLPECRDGVRQHPVCLEKRAKLLNWRYAVGQIASDSVMNQKYCLKRTGQKPLLPRWLAMYQGAADKTRVCGMIKKRGRWVDLPLAPVTQRVMEYRQWLSKNWKPAPSRRKSPT